MKRLTVFGDSIATGQGCAIHHSWVVKLSEALEPLGVQVQRAAANGRTSRQALEAMPYEIQQHPPDILLVQLGLNDCNCWATDKDFPRVSQGAFEWNMREIEARALACGVKVTKCITSHQTAKCAVHAYNEVLRFGQRFPIDIDKVFGCRIREDLMVDRIHLNEKGHLIYFGRILKAVKEILNELD
jgi:lysophospholipase L1-like esterase